MQINAIYLQSDSKIITYFLLVFDHINQLNLNSFFYQFDFIQILSFYGWHITQNAGLLGLGRVFFNFT